MKAQKSLRRKVLTLVCLVAYVSAMAREHPQSPLQPEAPLSTIKFPNVSPWVMDGKLVGLSPDGKLVAALLGRWQLEIHELEGHHPPLQLEITDCEMSVYSRALFSPQGKFVAHFCGGKYLIWELRSGAIVGALLCRGSGGYASWSFDETRFAAQCVPENNQVAVWDTTAQKEVARLDWPDKTWIVGIAFDQHGNLLVSTDRSRVHVYDGELRELRNSHLGSMFSWMTPSLHHTTVAGVMDPRFNLFLRSGSLYSLTSDLAPKKLARLATYESELWAVADDGRLFIVDLSGGTKWYPENTRIAPVIVYSVAEQRTIKMLQGDLDSAVLTDDGRIVAIANRSEVWIWHCCE